MATEVIAGKWNQVEQVAASKGLSLSTTAARIALPFGTNFLQLIGTTYSTAVVARVGLCPWLTVLKTADLLATDPTDYSTEAQDGSTGTSATLSSLGTLAQNDALYIGSAIPFGGVHIDVDGTNSNASVLTVSYWNGTAWADTSATDATDSGGASLGQDGTVTWTIPTAWATARLKDTQAATAVSPGPALYWTRWVWSAALDSSVTLDHIIAVAPGYLELPTGLPWEQGVLVGPGGVSAVEALTDAGTALLLVNCATRSRFTS